MNCEEFTPRAKEIPVILFCPRQKRLTFIFIRKEKQFTKHLCRGSFPRCSIDSFVLYIVASVLEVFYVSEGGCGNSC